MISLKEHSHRFLSLTLWTILISLIVAPCSSYAAKSQDFQDFNFNWRFIKGEQNDATSPGLDDSEWQKVDLPHDWAIHGPFGALDADGDQAKLPWRGTAWYRKRFELPKKSEGKRLILMFDAVMASPTVYLNGEKVGSWIYGYNSFHIDATDAAKFGESNVLSVHVNTMDHYSRWYPGAGIYRKVSVLLKDHIHIPVWGVFVTTPDVNDDEAKINASVEVINHENNAQTASVQVTLLDPDGKKVADCEKKIDVPAGELIKASLDMTVSKPQRWDINHPHLYTAVTRIIVGDREADCEKTNFGIRTFKVTANDGFHLNGRRVQLQGVNLHHAHGPLGSAFFPRAMERQLQIMKEMGVNAIRTSHNMPAPELPELCDRMGLIVYNEAFDKYGRTAGARGTFEQFADGHAEKEFKNFIRRDRNHPCVFFWSVGNEVSRLDGETVTKKLVAYVRKHDTTRNISQGFCHKKYGTKDSTVLNHLESAGWNYGARYLPTRQNYPDMPILYTESASAFGTRGSYVFEFPKSKTNYTNTGECRAWVVTSARWSDIPEVEFEYMKRDKYVAGEFVWTGFDYLGEPTPYNGRLAKDKQGRRARSSYFGIVDLAGLPKDSYWLYRSHWRPDVPTVYVSPHWNWKGHEGKPVPVFVYTNGDEAEVFVNGKSLGRRKKGQVPDSGILSEPYFKCVHSYRIIWPDVPYTPGELKAVAYKDGKKIGESSVKTAGEAAELKLTVDRPKIKADGMDLAYVTIEMVDKDGNVCPWAMDDLKFEADGKITFMGVANGNQMGFDTLTDSTHPLFYGKAVAVLRSQYKKPGKGKLIVSAPEKGFKSKVTIKTMRD